MSLPWICPKHPNAQIRKLWDRTLFVFSDEIPRGTGIDSNYKWECAVCGQELAPEAPEATQAEEEA